MSYIAARDLLLSRVQPVGTETVPLSESFRRVLAEEITAAENVPAFDRSPYDGYAFRAADLAAASRESPVTLWLTEEIPAGAVPTLPVTPGRCAKILTGAPIPEGADAVINFEETAFTDREATFFAPVAPGSNIVRAGDDVRKGELLLRRGDVIDAGAAGTLAAQGVAAPLVYRVPRVAVLSTGSELVEAEASCAPGQIRNSNAHTLSAALRRAGCEPVYLGIAADSAEDIAARMEQGLSDCDALICTGGVSVGDYDLTPDAMERIGAEMLFRGVALKPGMACAYAVRDGKLLCGLSGNPASSLTNFYMVALPALRALCGAAQPIPPEITMALTGGFKKPSPGVRVLRGQLDLSDGTARLRLTGGQSNGVLSSAIGCDALAVIPAGSGPIAPGTMLKGMLI